MSSSAPRVLLLVWRNRASIGDTFDLSEFEVSTVMRPLTERGTLGVSFTMTTSQVSMPTISWSMRWRSGGERTWDGVIASGKDLVLTSERLLVLMRAGAAGWTGSA